MSEAMSAAAVGVAGSGTPGEAGGVDKDRRTWIAITCGVGAVGGVATAVPFVASFAPSERARAAGAPVQVDISGVKPGEKLVVEWRGKPVWIVRRTPEQLESLKKTEPLVADPNSQRTQYPTPDYAKNQYRSIKPEVFVGVGICSHLGCSPVDKFTPGAQPSLPDDWAGGFLCPCHGSTFDFAGRVFKNKPAPDNLEVPPHMYVSDTVLLIGEDKKA
ncbi:MAG: ubiquinol-cytochrome c reductase iron-sulfur subunit [Rubrivivax sp.]|nr:ubiquinol-cytochrome c reductase iron-sulfur subunit [Rubrivivax sp.]